MLGPRLGILIAAAALAGCGSAGANEERPVGPVVDRADVLPADAEARLDRELRDYYRDHATAIVVASLPSLEGRTIEQVAFTTFNTWGIGDADTDRGLLILVAPNERKVRIEVGCGLESVITNAFASTVIDGDIVPLFEAGDFVGGIDAGIAALEAELAAHPQAHATSPICTAQERLAA